ncbi:hypothetical protein, partial [Arcticibacter tournemirensis]
AGYGESRAILHDEEATATGIPTRTQLMAGYRGNDFLSSMRNQRETPAGQHKTSKADGSPGLSGQERQQQLQKMDQIVREKLKKMSGQSAISAREAVDLSKLMKKRVDF